MSTPISLQISTSEPAKLPPEEERRLKRLEAESAIRHLDYLDDIGAFEWFLNEIQKMADAALSSLESCADGDLPGVRERWKALLECRRLPETLRAQNRDKWRDNQDKPASQPSPPPNGF